MDYNDAYNLIRIGQNNQKRTQESPTMSNTHALFSIFEEGSIFRVNT